jgi:molybdate transport system substrate-binding protein
MAAQQMPELKAVPGIDPSPLPPDLQLVIVFSAGMSPVPGDRQAAEALVAFLSSADAASVLKARGLDPP